MLYTTYTYRIVVLTYNRPLSLLRLLKSLQSSHYNYHNHPSWKLILEIHIDGGGGQGGQLVENIAENFNFTHGEKIVLKSSKNVGVMGAWRDAWSWRDRNRENKYREVLQTSFDVLKMSPFYTF